MMYFFLELILLLVYVTLANTEGDTETSPTNSCKNIKCLATENPVCVKLINNSDRKPRDTFVIAVNECEVNYAKCTPGVEATIVPMKNCEHQIKKNSKKLVPKKRRRRQLSHISMQADYGSYNNDYDSKENLYKYPPKHINNGQDESEPPTSSYDNHPKTENVYSHYKQKIKLDDSYGDSNDDERDGDDSQEFEKQPTDDADSLDFDAGEKNDDDDDATTETGDTNHASLEQSDGVTEIDEKQKSAISMPNMEDKEENGEEGEDAIIWDPDYDETGDKEANSVEYKNKCPTECPARDVMVCARCDHNIYRTFLSVCHLRLFNCRHPNEKLELVSRRPCMQSAPFLTGLPIAKTKLKGSNDQDLVLRYIRCREKGRLQRDPRCKF